VALWRDDNAFISQHIGDLETPEADTAFRAACTDLQQLYAPAGRLVCDRHPDYLSSVYAAEQNLPGRAVQHHHAHLASCMAENELSGDLLGVVWDGTGYGLDDTVWGGNFCGPRRAGASSALRPFRPFPLPGGDRAVREPRRSALGILFELGEKSLDGWTIWRP